ncbi:MAG: signal peptidase II [Verrucomicrobia bacterium]|nr:signal peptidase II [Verrucomicrobiota bacterium]
MPFSKLLLYITLPLYLLDQATKFWTVEQFPPPWSEAAYDVPVIPDFFHLVRVHNQGVAFGFGNGTAWAPVVFLLVPLLALVMLRVFWLKGVFQHLWSRLAVALLLCGVFGNLTDRLLQGFLLQEHVGETFWSRLSAGYVVDFIAVKLPWYDHLVPSSGGWWPAFNVSDSCICIAACLLFLGGMREEKKTAG